MVKDVRKSSISPSIFIASGTCSKPTAVLLLTSKYRGKGGNVGSRLRVRRTSDVWTCLRGLEGERQMIVAKRWSGALPHPRLQKAGLIFMSYWSGLLLIPKRALAFSGRCFSWTESRFSSNSSFLRRAKQVSHAADLFASILLGPSSPHAPSKPSYSGNTALDLNTTLFSFPALAVSF